MAIQKENVSIDVQDIIDLLHSGYTWFKKDDLGYGSIQEKFNALDIHIKTIQKHPDLKDVDTIAKVFTITNRNKQDNGSTITSAVNNSTNEFSMASLPKTDERSNTGEQRETGISNISDRTINETTSSSFATAGSTDLSAFANL
jgi:hypothetical protein